jgi:UDPglucose--hexose-1-phosphate uridylyltransferase
MYKQHLEKPDGRRLTLYARRPFSVHDAAGTLRSPVQDTGPHLRWHPLRGEWVAYASRRQHRTFLPTGTDPLAPTTDPAQPTEVPPGEWDIAAFDNQFPALGGPVTVPDASIVDTRPALGACEVVVFGRDGTRPLARQPLSYVRLLIDVWADRIAELGARPEVRYVMPFENRGTEVGVTLHHPHGQIYAYPFVPPVPARELEQQRAALAEGGRGLLECLVEDELADGRRILYAGPHAVAFVPVCARFPYELWVMPRRRAESVVALDDESRDDLAVALHGALTAYETLWERPMPYVMVMHGGPTDGEPHPEAHVHVEFYPAYRMPGRLKYLAGSELGAGMFTADTLPEATAAELRAVLDARPR